MENQTKAYVVFLGRNEQGSADERKNIGVFSTSKLAEELVSHLETLQHEARNKKPSAYSKIDYWDYFDFEEFDLDAKKIDDNYFI